MRIFGEQFYRGGAGIRGYLVDTCMGTGGDMRILGGQFYGNGAWICGYLVSSFTGVGRAYEDIWWTLVWGRAGI